MSKKYIFGILLLFCMGNLSAQTLAQAKKMFESNQFDKAKTAFSKLIKRTPNHAETNFYYGASLYETGELENSVPYLEKSAKRKYIAAYRYLGKAYADLFRFDEAIENYETHIEWLIEKKRDSEPAKAELAALRIKARMLKYVEIVTVIDSFVVSKQQLLDTYKISLNSGKIGMNANKNGIIYENEMGNKRILSEKNGEYMQLYTQSKLLDGWGELEAIQSLNTDCNLNFPFLMGDGTTLYFASDGEGTLGGYDIFVTRYDSEDNTYLRPSNIGVPFNSTANDYLFAIDEFNHLGWFVTDRNQPEDKVCVYVFIPNESKETYNFEAYGTKFMKDVATLQSIRTTWTNEAEVSRAKQKLAQLMQEGYKEKSRKHDFKFVVNDNHTYTTLSNFQSKKAHDMFCQIQVKEKDLNNTQKALEQKRLAYEKEIWTGKKELIPSILELEKHILTLTKEIKLLTNEVRKLETEELGEME